MSEYSVLLYIVIGLVLFVYFSWFVTSLRINKSKLNNRGLSDDEFISQKIIDPKKEQLSFFDLNNYAQLFLGLLLIIIVLILVIKSY